MKLILITGATSSGKTSISIKLKEKLIDANLISLDDYYFEESYFKDTKNINWDIPEAFNWKKLNKNINSLMQNKSFSKKEFIYGKNIYGKEKQYTPKKFLIVEGILSPYDKDLRIKADNIIYLNSNEDMRYKRRLERDKKLIKNFSLKKFNNDWKDNVLKLEMDLINTFKEYSDLIIDTNDIEQNSNQILNLIYDRIIK